MRNRDFYESLHHSKYEQVGSIGDPCVYCGDFSDTLDHLPPISSVPFVENLKDLHGEFWLLPACRDCNSALSNFRITSVENRQDIVAKRIERKYAKLFRMPDWDEDELKQLKGTMRKQVTASMKLKRIHATRLAFAKRLSERTIDEISI